MAKSDKDASETVTLSLDELDRLVQGRIERMIALNQIPNASSSGAAGRGSLRRAEQNYGARATLDYAILPMAENWDRVRDAFERMKPQQKQAWLRDTKQTFSQIREARLKTKMFSLLNGLPV